MSGLAETPVDFALTSEVADTGYWTRLRRVFNYCFWPEAVVECLRN